MSITAAARADIREAARQLAQFRAIPEDEFPGHKGIACSNLEGYLGRYPVALLDALEQAESRELGAPEGIAHIGHRLSVTGGEDAPLGLFCDTCGDYLIEWDG